LFVNNENHRVVDPAQVLQHATHKGYTVTHPSNRGEERIRRYEIERYRQYQHIKVHPQNIKNIPFIQGLFMIEDTAFGFASYGMAALTVSEGAGLCVGSGGIGCAAAVPLITVAAPGAIGGGLATHYLVLKELEHYGVWERTP